MHYRLAFQGGWMPEDQYLSLADAAAQSPYSQEYLSLRARQGKLKAVKQGRNWVTTKAWLDEYLHQVDEAQRELKNSTIARDIVMTPTAQPAASRHSYEPSPFHSQTNTGARSLWSSDMPTNESRRIGLLEEPVVARSVISPVADQESLPDELELTSEPETTADTPEEPIWESTEQVVNSEPTKKPVREIPVTVMRNARKQILGAGLSPSAMNREPQSAWFDINEKHESVEPEFLTAEPQVANDSPDIGFWPAPSEPAKRQTSFNLQPVLATAIVGVFMFAVIFLNKPLQIGTNIAAGLSQVGAMAGITGAANEEASFARINADTSGTVAGASIDLEPGSSVSRTIAAGVVAVINGLTQDDESLARNLSEWLTDNYDLPF